MERGGRGSREGRLDRELAAMRVRILFHLDHLEQLPREVAEELQEVFDEIGRVLGADLPDSVKDGLRTRARKILAEAKARAGELDPREQFLEDARRAGEEDPPGPRRDPTGEGGRTRRAVWGSDEDDGPAAGSRRA